MQLRDCGLPSFVIAALERNTTRMPEIEEPVATTRWQASPKSDRVAEVLRTRPTKDVAAAVPCSLALVQRVRTRLRDEAEAC